MDGLYVALQIGCSSEFNINIPIILNSLFYARYSLRTILNPKLDSFSVVFRTMIMVKIKSIEYFRVLPRWLFVKVLDENDNFGWGESTLEGHTQAVEGCLDALIQRFRGFEAE